MSNSAYIRLVEESTVPQVTLDEVKAKFDRYVEMTSKTGKQLAWGYADAVFHTPLWKNRKERANGFT